MTDTNENEVKTFTAEEVQELLAKETAGLKSKVEELLGESKSAKQKARELEELQRQAEEEGLKQREEFRTLYEREQKAKAELAEKFQQKEVESSALSLAAELTRDTKRAELLKEQVSKYARYTEDGVKFEMGGVEVDSDKILTHIKDNYPFLVDGSGATGGQAPGNKSSGGATKKFNEYSGAELKELRASDPALYERLKTEFNSAN